MKLLIDTHVVIWSMMRPERVSPVAASAIAEADEVRVSVVSAWEMEIKRAKGKLRLPGELGPALASLAIEPLPVVLPHVLAVGSLPDIHSDPFDRLLVAQAMVEGLTLVTADRAIREYPIATLAAT